jgi:hypothetical protein
MAPLPIIWIVTEIGVDLLHIRLDAQWLLSYDDIGFVDWRGLLSPDTSIPFSFLAILPFRHGLRYVHAHHPMSHKAIQVVLFLAVTVSVDRFHLDSVFSIALHGQPGIARNPAFPCECCFPTHPAT